MTHPISGIDHALVAVADLAAARGTYERLGFTLTPRGRHIGWGTANACIMFERDYIELVGIVDRAQPLNGLDVFLDRRGSGLLGLAFATSDADAVHARPGLAELTEPPTDLGRLLELPEGDVTPRFRLVAFRSGVTPGLSAFVCQHLTPDLIRRPTWLAHANGARGLDGITVAVDDPAALAPAYRSLFGAESVREGRGRLNVAVGRHTMRFLSPERMADRYPGLDIPADRRCALVVTLRCASLTEVTHFLTATGVALPDVAGARLVVAPAAACGVALEFAEG